MAISETERGGISNGLYENATACAHSKGYAEGTTSAPLVLWTGPAHYTAWFVLPETEDAESIPRSGLEISPSGLGLVPATAHLERSAAQRPLPARPTPVRHIPRVSRGVRRPRRHGRSERASVAGRATATCRLFENWPKLAPPPVPPHDFDAQHCAVFPHLSYSAASQSGLYVC